MPIQDSVPETHRRVGKSWQPVGQKRSDTAGEGSKSFGLVAHALVRVGLQPESIHHRPTLRLIHSSNQRGVDHVEFLEQRFQIDRLAGALGVGPGSIHSTHEWRSQKTARSVRQDAGQVSCLLTPMRSQWDESVGQGEATGIGGAFSVPNQEDGAKAQALGAAEGGNVVRSNSARSSGRTRKGSLQKTEFKVR